MHDLLGSAERLYGIGLARCLRDSRCYKRSLVYYLGGYTAFLCTSSYGLISW
jgi:hypothetical protein